MSEETININNKEIAVYAKTLRQLLNENAVCEIERNLRKLLTQLTDGIVSKDPSDRMLSPLRNTFLDSYFNGAPDDEMKVFARINAGRFFSDSALAIIRKITAMDPEDGEPLLRQYMADRAQFVRQAEESLQKLAEKGIIRK